MCYVDLSLASSGSVMLTKVYLEHGRVMLTKVYLIYLKKIQFKIWFDNYLYKVIVSSPTSNLDVVFFIHFLPEPNTTMINSIATS